MRPPFFLTLGLVLALGSCAARSRSTFLGDWRVIWLTAPGVSALAPTEATGWVGTVATYDDHRAVFGRDACNAASYTTRTVTPEGFTQEYRVRPTDLGLQGEAITLVTVSCASAWTNRGSLLIVKSADEMLTTWDGVFFVLERRLP